MIEEREKEYGEAKEVTTIAGDAFILFNTSDKNCLLTITRYLKMLKKLHSCG